MNLKNKNKPSVNRKKEINEQKSINFFKKRKNTNYNHHNGKRGC